MIRFLRSMLARLAARKNADALDARLLAAREDTFQLVKITLDLAIVTLDSAHAEIVELAHELERANCALEASLEREAASMRLLQIMARQGRRP